MERAQDWAQRGDSPVLAPTTSGGTPLVREYQQSYPGASISVFITGGTTLATIYSDNASTPLANPFTADQYGHWFFYAANGTYDVEISGGGLATPYTLGGILLFDPAAGVNAGALTFTEQTNPGLSAAGQSIIYMDATTHTLLVSENGGAYVPLISAAGSGGIIRDFHLLTASSTLITPSVTPAPDNDMLIIVLQQDATGGKQVTWSSDFLTVPPDPATLPVSSYSTYMFCGVGGQWLLTATMSALT